MAKVNLKLHGHLSQLAGQATYELEVREGDSVTALLARWQAERGERAPSVVDKHGRLQDGLIVAVDDALIGTDLQRALRGGEVIDLLAELAGGQSRGAGTRAAYRGSD